MATLYESSEVENWRVIVAINPTATKTGKQYYAELSKVNSKGTLYGVKYWKFYNSPEEAFKQMYIFAQREKLIVSEDTLREWGFYDNYKDSYENS